MIAGIIKQIISSALFPSLLKGDKFIVTYHHICQPNEATILSEVSTPYNIFVENINFFSKYFNITSLDKLVDPEYKAGSKPLLAITFDDGFKSVKEIAFDILNKRNIPFTVFLNKKAIVSNRLWVTDFFLNNNTFMSNLNANKNFEGLDLTDIENIKNNIYFNSRVNTFVGDMNASTPLYMNKEDVLWLQKRGVLFGSHGSNHPVLSKCTPEVVYSDSLENKEFLENLLQTPMQHYAIPFGKKNHYTSEVIDILKKCGYRYIYSSNPSRLQKGDYETGLFPRVGLLNENRTELRFYINRQYIKKIDI